MIDEDSAYAQAADELETNQVDKATWARAFSESDGDTQKTKARYIVYRVRKLTQRQQVPASTTGGHSHSGSTNQTSAVDLEHNRKAQEEKERLWKEAQERTLGYSVNADSPKAKKPDTAQAAPSPKDTSYADNAAPSYGEDMTALYKAAIGEKNTSYYLTKFEQFDQQGLGLKASWNWPAFFFSGFWALYRKMYVWFFVFWGVNTFETMFAKAGAFGFMYIIFLAGQIAFGIYANSIYHSHVRKKIEVAQSTISAPNVLTRLSDKGGVNTWAIWVAIGLTVLAVLGGIVAAIVSPVQQQPSTASIQGQQETQNPSEAVEVPPAAPSDSGPYGQMEALYNASQFSQLLEVAEGQLAQSPNDPNTLNFAGLALNALGNKESARVLYERAINLKPDVPLLYYNLASTYDPYSEYHTIIKLLKTAQKVDPNNGLVNDSLKGIQAYAQKMDADHQAEVNYMKQQRSNGSNTIDPDCQVKPVMTEEELQHWRTCKAGAH